MPTFGDTTAGSGSFPASTDRALVDRFSLIESATLMYGYIYFDASSTGGNCKFIIMEDDGGDEPAGVLAVSSGVAVPNGGGWVQFPLSGSLAAGDYWIGGVSDNFTHWFGEDDPGGSAPDVKMANGTFSYATPPSGWPGTDGSYSSVGLNAYVEYSTGGGSALAPPPPRAFPRSILMH